MKTNFLTLFFLTMAGWVFAQQSDCLVKMASISGSYVGECKKGLAHGQGSATGIDFYQGEFYKGLPEGKGIYKWANGSYYDGEWKNGLRQGMGKYVYGDSIAEGFWKADRYQGKKPTPPYKIIVNRNIQRFTISKGIETGNGVKIKLLLGGSDNSEVNDLTLGYTNGSEYRNIGTYGIENTTVPLDVTVRYTTWNQLHTVQYEVVFEITILDPGVWHVTLTNM
jgi:hypothetical protein